MNCQSSRDAGLRCQIKCQGGVHRAAILRARARVAPPYICTTGTAEGPGRWDYVIRPRAVPGPAYPQNTRNCSMRR
jgi:hypothetical protein